MFAHERPGVSAAPALLRAFGPLAALLAAAGSVWGCGGSPETIGAACDLLPGDLAISEIMADPVDDDAGREWIEIYNASSRAQPLDRLVVQRLGASATGVDVAADHMVGRDLTLRPASYLVIGNGAVGLVPIDYSYDVAGDGLGLLANSAGGVRLMCGGREIDAAWYGTEGGAPSPSEGRSIGFDGGVAPDAVLNDRGELWCPGGEPYDGLNSGTPGRANTACGRAACDEDGRWRDIIAPGAGDLVITEVLANPDGVDAGKEWLELYVAAPRPVDLNGLVVLDTNLNGSTRRAPVESVACAEVAPGEYVVIGTSREPDANGGAPVDWVAPELSLYNDAGTLELRHRGALVDAAKIPAAASGVSASLDPEWIGAASNDAADAFCASRTTTLFAGAGTPGFPNDPCGSACLEAGTLRPVHAPAPGDLVITEIYSDAGATAEHESTADDHREWLELYIAGGPVDLNGLEIVNTLSTARTETVEAADCITVAHGSYVVAGDPVALAPEGVTATLPIGGFTLYNATSSSVPSVSLVLGELVLDAVAYPGGDEGSSYQLTAGLLDARDNDDPAGWCVSTTQQPPFVGGNGSPGAPNDDCPR